MAAYFIVRASSSEGMRNGSPASDVVTQHQEEQVGRTAVHSYLAIYSDLFKARLTLLVLLTTLVGGGIITFLESMLGSYTEHHLIALGAIFVVFVLFLPDGLMGLVRRAGGRRPGDTR